MSEFLQRLEGEIHSRRLLPRGEKILVAVSGGLDSMTLLRALHLLAKKWRWKISVAHLNHQLRGRSSDADEQLVRKVAAAWKLPVLAERADVKSFAKKSKLSIEMAARKLRHEFLSRIARQKKIRVVALAHHADDQVELFFLRLLRGAGGEGLAGMKWSAPSPADAKITLVRPLLGFTKNELEKFASDNRIAFREDATNSSSDFLRNRIRNELLPLLRKNYQPGLNRTILRLMEIVGAEAELVGDAARRAMLSLRLDSVRPPVEHCPFVGLPLAIQRRILQSQLMEFGVAADFELVESLRQSADRFVSISSKISAARDAKGKIIFRAEQNCGYKKNEVVVRLGGAGEANFDGVKFNWSFGNGSRGRPPRQIRQELFDADKIGKKIILRHWRAGDRFRPIGLKSAAKLQDLFTNAKIPRERRHDLIVAEAAGGEIFWVEGLRISENFKLTLQTKRRLIWNWRRMRN